MKIGRIEPNYFSSVVLSVAAMLPLVCITVVTDYLQRVLSGVARGCGGSTVPMAILLGSVLHMGSRGLWMGIVCGSLLQMSAITFFTDWPKMRLGWKSMEMLLSQIAGLLQSWVILCPATSQTLLKEFIHKLQLDAGRVHWLTFKTTQSTV